MSSESKQDSNNNKLVAVTGASGYVAGVLIQHLINGGYSVRGSVRSLANKDKVKHLTDLFSSDKLQLFEADLLVDGSFKSMFDGCSIIFHTASPFQLTVKDPQTDLVNPAVHGTTNVITTALNTKSVNRIVLTSSVAAVRRSDVEAGHVYTESDWNNTATIQTSPYPYSKTMAEKKGWELVKEYHNKNNVNKPDLVVINPSLVLGTPLTYHKDSTSVRRIVDLMNGVYKDKGANTVRINCVDVNDVARAHIAAAENKNASGRYIVSSFNAISDLEHANVLRKYYPNYPLPTTTNGTLSADNLVSAEKIKKELGINLTPIEQSVKEMAAKLIELGAIKPPTSDSQAKL